MVSVNSFVVEIDDEVDDDQLVEEELHDDDVMETVDAVKSVGVDELVDWW